MKKLPVEDIQAGLNQILMTRKLIEEPLDFDTLTTMQSLTIICDAVKVLEYTFYYKGVKSQGAILRKIYTLCEKLLLHEKKKIQLFRYDDLQDNRVRINPAGYEFFDLSLYNVNVKEKKEFNDDEN